MVVLLGTFVAVGLNRKLQADLYGMYVTTAVTTLATTVGSAVHPIVVIRQHRPLANRARRLLRMEVGGAFSAASHLQNVVGLSNNAALALSTATKYQAPTTELYFAHLNRMLQSTPNAP